MLSAMMYKGRGAVMRMMQRHLSMAFEKWQEETTRMMHTQRLVKGAIKRMREKTETTPTTESPAIAELLIETTQNAMAHDSKPLREEDARKVAEASSPERAWLSALSR